MRAHGQEQNLMLDRLPFQVLDQEGQEPDGFLVLQGCPVGVCLEPLLGVVPYSVVPSTFGCQPFRLNMCLLGLGRCNGLLGEVHHFLEHACQ